MSEAYDNADRVRDHTQEPKEEPGKDSNALPPILTLTEIEADPPKRPPVLIHGLLYREGKMLISGPSKSRKTFLLFDLAACISAGRPWLGFNADPCRVLYIDLELMRWETRERMTKIMEAREVWDKERVHVWNLRGHRLNLVAVKKRIVDHCKAHDIGVVCIDPYYRLSNGADENAAGDIANFLNDLSDLVRETGAAVVMTHHYAKGNAAGKSSIDRMSGSGVFARDPDALVAMTEAEDSTDEDPVFIVEATVRSFAPVKAFGVRWSYPVWERDESIDAARLKGAGGRPREHGVEEILDLLPTDGARAATWSKTCFEERGISKGTFYRLKALAESSGKIRKAADGTFKAAERSKT